MLRSVAMLASALMVPSLALSQESAQEQVPGHTEFLGGASMSNSYARGNLDDWFAAITDTPGRTVGSGSAAFFHGRVSFFSGHAKSTRVGMGVGVGMNIPADHSLWGTSLFYGGRTELVLKPLIATAYVPVRIMPEDLEGITVTLWPGLSYAAILGDMNLGATQYDFGGGDGIGGTAAASVDMFLGDNFGLSVEAGVRILTATLAYKDSGSPTGYSQPRLASGEGVMVDLGGSYAMVGLIFRF